MKNEGLIVARDLPECVAISNRYGPEHLIIQTRNARDHLLLHIARQAGGDAVDVHLQRVATFRLEKQLVPRLIGEAHDFVFDRRAVARSAGADLAAVHWRAVQIGADQLVHRLVRVGDVTRQLLDAEFIGEKGKGLRLVVAGLQFQLAVVDGAAVEAGRSARFEAREAEAQPGERGADAAGGTFASPAAGGFRFARVHQRLQEGAGGDHHGAGAQITDAPALAARFGEDPCLARGAGEHRVGSRVVGVVAPTHHQLLEGASLPTSYLRLRAYPFTRAVEEFVRQHERVYVVEQNRDGQMLSLMRMDLDPALAPRLRSVRHYNGLPIDARSITDEIVRQETGGPTR